MKDEQELIEAAIEASKHAYAPYSNFQVGAALRLKNGEIIPGCNVENGSIGLTNCAERTAIYAAVARGSREFVKLAIFVDVKPHVSPCGACRQVLMEFAPQMEILLVNRDRKVKRTSVKELLPLAFTDYKEAQNEREKA